MMFLCDIYIKIKSRVKRANGRSCDHNSQLAVINKDRNWDLLSSSRKYDNCSTIIKIQQKWIELGYLKTNYILPDREISAARGQKRKKINYLEIHIVQTAWSKYVMPIFSASTKSNLVCLRHQCPLCWLQLKKWHKYKILVQNKKK